MASIFAQWNAGKLSSYLVEISAEILAHRRHTGDYLIDKILDAAGQEGDGQVVGDQLAGVRSAAWPDRYRLRA